MAIDFLTFEALSRQWTEKLSGAGLRGAAVSIDGRLMLKFGLPRVEEQWLIAGQTPFPLAAVGPASWLGDFAKTLKPHPVSLKLNSIWKNARFCEISTLDYERVLVLSLEKFHRFGRKKSDFGRLYLDFTRRPLEITAEGPDGLIFTTSRRAMHSGKLPFDFSRRFPVSVTSTESNSENSGIFADFKQLKKYLLTTYQGFSPELLDLIYRQNSDGELSPAQYLAFFAGLYSDSTDRLEQYARSRIIAEAGNWFEFSLSPAQLALTDSAELIARIYAAYNQLNQLRRDRRELTNSLNRLESALELQICLLEKLNPDQLNMEGQLIYANLFELNQLPRTYNHSRPEVVEIRDFDDRPSQIQIDPELGFEANAERKFRQYRKQKRTLEYLNNSIGKLKRKRQYLKDQLEKLPAAADLYINFPDYLQLQKDKAAAVTNRGGSSGSGSRGVKIADSQIRLYKYQNHNLLLGRSAKGSTRLLSKYSSPRDTWIHLKDRTSGHVIIKWNSGISPSAYPFDSDSEFDQVLGVAGAALVKHSRLSADDRIEIIYCERKYIRRLKGQTGCLVTYRQVAGRTIGRQDFERLQTIDNLKERGGK